MPKVKQIDREAAAPFIEAASHWGDLEQAFAAHRLAERERLATVTPEVIEAGAHVLSEWLNDNAPIGESVYRKPAEAAFLAMLKGSTDG